MSGIEVAKPTTILRSTTTGLRARYLEDELRIRHNLRLDHGANSIDTVIKAPPRGPDIAWNPSLKTFLNRVDRLHMLKEAGPTSPPAGFPLRVNAPWAWTGSSLASDEYIIHLSDADIAEIETALESFRKIQGFVTFDEINPTTFPLPCLGAKLREISTILHSGIGFSVLRGLQPSKYTAVDNVVIYIGLTSYIAPKRGVQDSSGNMLIHVKDLGDKLPNTELRQSPYAHNAQPFHNDVCDILAMYVQEQAAQGGESHLASCATIYNEIASSRPDVLHTLAAPDWIFDKHQVPAYWNTRALLFNFGDKGPGFCFSRRPITGSPTSPRGLGVPPMTEKQAEAIDMVHFSAMRNKVTMRLQPGDIQLVNNLAIQHAREAFVDSPNQKRHIIRLWLRNDELAWDTPIGLRKTWFEKYGDSGRRRIARWNVFPGASRERVLFRSDSCS